MQAGGVTQDHSTYLVPPGSADVLFPTNFPQLQHLYRQACATSNGEGGVPSQHVAHADLYVRAGGLSGCRVWAPRCRCRCRCRVINRRSSRCSGMGPAQQCCAESVRLCGRMSCE